MVEVQTHNTGVEEKAGVIRDPLVSVLESHSQNLAMSVAPCWCHGRQTQNRLETVSLNPRGPALNLPIAVLVSRKKTLRPKS